MGQTLTHGIYLPDEGERNCYNGLAANWQILDNSVGTIAAHTAALAGKAPLVHTHTKSDITDFPAYGTAAGTICEGNDSRLSDARTPLSHTHTKANITDLLNSNFIPSANNSYDLGSSSYQWNNLYAKNYYYNGTAWGLNVKNTWTNFNVINGYRFEIRQTLQEIGVIPSSNQWNGFYFVDKNENPTLTFEHAFMGSGETRFKINMVDNYASHNSNSTVLIEFLRFYANPDGSAFCIGADARPLINNTYNLGTSTNKWKSFNGINPGALSIFNPSATQDPIDVPNTWATDGSAWNTLNVSNMGDGWICLTYRLCGANDYILARFGGASANIYPSMIFPATKLQGSNTYYLYVLMPVTKAMGNIYLEINLDSNAVLVKHSFIPAYGTV